jgi:hypothetical protein
MENVGWAPDKGGAERSDFNEARPVTSVHVVAVTLAAAALFVLAESELRLPIRGPGHRALFGALALGILAAGSPRLILAAFGALAGVAAAMISGNPLALLVWALPALLLVVARPNAELVKAVIIVAAGIALGFVRYFSTSGLPHHTPDIIRLAGHLGFGAAGGVLAAIGGWWLARSR